MVLLAADSRAIAEHALSGAVSPEVTPYRVLNEAGEWLTNARSWNWLQGGTEALPLVAGQNYVDLPEDFGSVDVEKSGGFEGAINFCSLPEILRLRAYGQEVAGYYYHVAVSWDHADLTGTSTDAQHPVTATTAAQALAKKYPTPRLEIYPTPTTADTDGLVIFYERGWRRVDQDSDTIFLPRWMEGVYHRCIRIWAKGYEEDDVYPKDDALDRLKAGSEWMAAVAKDTRQQSDLGPINNGLTQTSAPVPAHRFTGIVANP